MINDSCLIKCNACFVGILLVSINKEVDCVPITSHALCSLFNTSCVEPSQYFKCFQLMEINVAATTTTSPTTITTSTTAATTTTSSTTITSSSTTATTSTTSKTTAATTGK